MPSLARVGALVATGALVTTGLVSGLTTPAVAATNDPRPVTIGASWLEGQLTNGLIHNDQYNFDDYGLTVDAGLSLAAIGGHSQNVSEVRDAMAAAVNHYISGDDFGDTGSTYAGAVAKTAVFAKAAGGDPSSFGGVDLVSRLEAQVSGTAPNDGRLFDTTSWTDYANTLGQAFAANALSAAGSTKALSVIDFLVKQQCSAGFFRLNFAPTGDADQRCDADPSATPDTDATAMAVLQLQAIGSTDATVTGSIANAESWLLAAQHADGSFGGGASTEGANTNSTGLAGWALGELGDDAAAAKAATWVRAHQADNPTACPDALSGETGAIGYDDAGVAAGRTDGITTAKQDQWRRSTAPTLPVLQWAPSATSALALTGPDGFVKAGSAVAYRLAGAAPGATLCVSGIGTAHRLTADATGTSSLDLTMPQGTAERVATAAAASGAADTASVQVLGARTLRVKPARTTVRRGARLHVVVRGLVSGERVALRLRGRTVKVGKANGHGRFVADVRVGRRLGKAKVVARGQFPTLRHGSVVVRVVR
jgi:hypothetical protein